MIHSPADTAARPAISRRRGQYAWALLDWAHQPYFTLIATFIFAPYFANHFTGNAVRGQEIWGYSQSFAGACIALLSPLLGAFADRMGRRKPWIAAFGVSYVLGNALLWFAAPDTPQAMPLVLGALVMAAISAEFIILFSNAMLPDLVEPAELGRLSGFGWGFGYIGGLLSLIVIIGAPGLKNMQGQLVGPLTAIWFLLFAQPFLWFTPDRPATGLRAGQAVRQGLAQLRQTVRQSRGHGNVWRFLIAHMIYSDGLAAIFAFGGIYGAGLFGWETFTLGLFGILLIIFATIGAFAGGWADDRFGSRRTVLVSVAGLVVALVGALSIQTDSIFFWVSVAPFHPGGAAFHSAPELAYLASGVLMGIFGGPAQAASRTLLARLAPGDMAGEFFGLFAMTGKATSFLAPVLIGLTTAALYSQRAGMVVILVFLVSGFAALWRVREAADESGPAAARATGG
ncbi:MAG: MFS transporter [Alphaproteobacteria bacterium]|nr:MFS transporter [Alphaproteobacteria bacterium]